MDKEVRVKGFLHDMRPILIILFDFQAMLLNFGKASEISIYPFTGNPVITRFAALAEAFTFHILTGCCLLLIL